MLDLESNLPERIRQTLKAEWRRSTVGGGTYASLPVSALAEMLGADKLDVLLALKDGDFTENSAGWRISYPYPACRRSS